MPLVQVPNSKVLNALAWLKSLNGITYGHDEVAPGTLAPDVRNIDCSELAERAVVDYLEIKEFPDYSLNQLAYCRAHGREIKYPDEAVCSMDLVFLTPGRPLPNPSPDGRGAQPVMGHVAIVVGALLPSQAGGIMLIEARGGKGVIYTPLDMFVKKFGARFAGVWRLVEIVETPIPGVPATPV
jgi:hypothetical protein